MPNMIGDKRCLSLVVVRDKLFVIGCGKDICEVFDNSCKKFVALKSPPVEYVDLTKTSSIGNQILVFQDNTATLLCYDIYKNEWSDESFEITEDIEEYSCVKLPCY